MKTMLNKISAVTVTLASAASAFAQEVPHAAEHEKAGVIPTAAQGVPAAVVALVVFAVVFGILALKVWPVISKGLADRENKIREEIESAEMARKQAKHALEQYQQSLAQARAEAQKMLETTKAQQTALAADLKAKADAELTQMRDRAMRDIDAAKRAAVAGIYGEAANLATAMAGKILRRQVNAGDQKALVEETLAQLQGMRN